MAKTSASRFVRSLLLFVFILQASKISALDCYGCFINPDHSDDHAENCPANLTESPVVNSETPKSDNVTTYLGILEKVINDSKLEMSQDHSCFTYYGYSPQSGKPQVFRYIYNKKPAASDCVNVTDATVGRGKICFCTENKCNDITIDLPAPSKPNANTESDPATKSQPESGKVTDPKASKPDPTKSSSSKVSFTLPSFFLIASFVMLLTTQPRG